MLSTNVQVCAHIDARLPIVLTEDRNVQNNNLTTPVIALCLQQSALTIYDPGNILLQTTLTHSEGLLVSYTLDPLTVFRKWRPHLNFMHHSPCYNSIRKFRYYGDMLPFCGITLQRNMVIISELFPDLLWMDK